MMWTLYALLAGFGMDLLLGDPHGFPHPVIAIGKLISALEKLLRRVLPATPKGERLAGGILWVLVTSISAGDTEGARRAVSMIVGRDTTRLDRAGIARAAVETVAENTSDGVVAPMVFLTLGGAPLGFFYKAVNTMDSMLGYVEPPYKNIGLAPARMDDVMNFLPARFSALLMLAAGGLLGMDAQRGWRIFRRDRYCHASPNSAQTESVCAGLLGLRLAGDAWYHGVLHKKPAIGDPVQEVEPEDIRRACRLLYGTAALSLAVCLGLGTLVWHYLIR